MATRQEKPPMQPTAPADNAQGWDQRLYPGLRVEGVPADLCATLVQAAGTLGVEAEHFLATLRAFMTAPSGTGRSRASGEAFLWQLEAAAARLRPAAETFELATQAYLSALDEHFTGLRAQAAAGEAAAEPWWSAPHDAVDPSALELCLRQCGFSYRHAVISRLTPSIEALSEHLSLLLHALSTLPPAGVLPIPALYAGLSELASTFQGHVVPHLLADGTQQAAGLPAAVQRLHALDASEDRSIEADLAWARGQLHEVRWIAEQTRANRQDVSTRRGILGGLLRRAAAPGRISSSGPEAWLALAEREWQGTISDLEALRSQSNAVGSSVP
jgi:hypothetical protein